MVLPQPHEVIHSGRGGGSKGAAKQKEAPPPKAPKKSAAKVCPTTKAPPSVAADTDQPALSKPAEKNVEQKPVPVVRIFFKQQNLYSITLISIVSHLLM